MLPLRTGGVQPAVLLDTSPSLRETGGGTTSCVPPRTIMSMEGYGTDAFLHLPRLGNRDEPLH